MIIIQCYSKLIIFNRGYVKDIGLRTTIIIKHGGAKTLAITTNSNGMNLNFEYNLFVGHIEHL